MHRGFSLSVGLVANLFTFFTGLWASRAMHIYSIENAFSLSVWFLLSTFFFCFSFRFGLWIDNEHGTNAQFRQFGTVGAPHVNECLSHNFWFYFQLRRIANSEKCEHTHTHAHKKIEKRERFSHDGKKLVSETSFKLPAAPAVDRSTKRWNTNGKTVGAKRTKFCFGQSQSFQYLNVSRFDARLIKSRKKNWIKENIFHLLTRNFF